MLSHAERVKQREGGDGGGAISEHYLRGMRGGKSFPGTKSNSGALPVTLALLFRGQHEAHAARATHAHLAHARTRSGKIHVKH